MKKISIIVPCYNEEESILLFYEKTLQALQEIVDVTYEFIFINDGSSDHTIDIIKQLSMKDKNVIYYSFSRNFGKEAGMYAGLSNATGDYCVIMDADLQHPPMLLKDMYYAITVEGYDCCAGKRIDRAGEGKIRNFFSKCFYKVISKMSKMDMSDGAGDFRMMTKQMVNALLDLKEYNRYMKGMFSFIGFETKWIEFHNVERVAGTSKWNLKSLFHYAFEGILSFSTTPLHISGFLGILLVFISFIMFGIIVTNLFLGNTLSAFFYITCLILFLSGIQMIFVSILGEYLAKDYMENKNRPIYIIKETNRKCL